MSSTKINYDSYVDRSQWAKSPKKLSEGVHFLLIRHSKDSAILSKIHSTDCDFAD